MLMLNWIKKLTQPNKNDTKETDYAFKWYEKDDAENPFNKQILDIRTFTQTVIATTSDQLVAARFSVNRNSNGTEFREQNIANETSVKTNLVYQHNGDRLEGIIFQAAEMEVKWDIFIYDNCFFFARSWTGDLVYKAHAEILSDKIIINRVDYDEHTDGVYAVNSVHFLMKSHAFGQVFPHYVTDILDDEKKIALLSFSQFGSKACYACLEEILDATVLENK